MRDKDSRNQILLQLAELSTYGKEALISNIEIRNKYKIINIPKSLCLSIHKLVAVCIPEFEVASSLLVLAKEVGEGLGLDTGFRR
jgi:hypothetical protein